MEAPNSSGDEMYILSPADIPPQAFSKMTTFGALQCCNFSLHDFRALIPSQPLLPSTTIGNANVYAPPLSRSVV